MRLGLFGGTFNPLHIGHLRATVEVREAFDLDQILLIPAASPPHKDMTGIVDARDRFHMVQAATADVSFLDVSDVELLRRGHSYTIDTLIHFRDHYGAEAHLFFIIGIDAFAEITTWKSYRDLFTLASFVVMERPGAKIKDLKGFIQKEVSPAYTDDETATAFHHPTWKAIHRLSITHLDISSTAIRKTIHQGGSVRFLVPPQVLTFIKEKGLYE